MADGEQDALDDHRGQVRRRGPLAVPFQDREEEHFDPTSTAEFVSMRNARSTTVASCAGT
jgi:hypothetical protein